MKDKDDELIDINRVKSVVQTTYDIYEREKTGLFSSKTYLEEVKTRTKKEIYENGRVSRSEWIDFRSYFDDEKRACRVVSEYSDGVLVTECKYNRKGKLIEGPMPISPEYKTTYGKAKIETREDKSKYETQYDHNARKIKVISYDKSGKVKWIGEYFYDGYMDMCVKSVSYDQYGKVTESMWSDYFYDCGRLTKLISYNQYGKVTDWSEYFYDRDRLTKLVLYDKNGNVKHKKDFFYDNKGLKYKEIDIWNSSDGHFEEEFRYNEHGDLVWMRWHPHRGDSWCSIQQQHEEAITTYEYRYDDKGNWIEKRQFRNGVSNLMFTREIEYL